MRTVCSFGLLTLWMIGTSVLSEIRAAEVTRVSGATSRVEMDRAWLSQFKLAPGVQLELLSKEPEFVTPVGIDRSDEGELFVVVNHTHHRPENYEGPKFDQIKVINPSNGRSHVFYEGTTHTTHVRMGPDGWLYVVERDKISRIRDFNHDGKADKKEVIVRLISVTDYPHNGLGDITLHPDGGMVFTLGENFGEPWDLVGSDRKVLSGTGEGGVFYCSPKGTSLRRIAKGFWNPFGVEVTPEGEIFVAENDPGSRPPCRLIHVLEGSDYGFQWNYGRDPFHPFVAWNGELRGTLGMIHPVGEGPSSIRQLGGGMMVPSWSQHKLEYFPLTRKGAGYSAQRELLIQGPEDFRPVAIAKYHDNTFYLTDWVSGSYPVHGQGRVWKLTIDPKKAPWFKPALEEQTKEAKLADNWRKRQLLPPLEKLFEMARSKDVYLADAALSGIASRLRKASPELMKEWTSETRLNAFVALRRNSMENTEWLQVAWDLAQEKQDEALWFECLRWIADAKVQSYEVKVAELLKKEDLSYILFEASLAALNTLQGNSRAGLLNAEVLWERLKQPDLSDRTKAYLLRLMPAKHGSLKEEILLPYLDASHVELRLEAIRKLRTKLNAKVEAKLLELLKSAGVPKSLKLEILQALATSQNPEVWATIKPLAQDGDDDIKDEANRALRFTAAEVRPFEKPSNRPAYQDVGAWIEYLKQVPGPRNLDQGKRLFFHPKVALCASCHRYDGQGGVLGPDLSLVSKQGDLTWIMDSILNPNREVAPQFYANQLDLVNGETFFGILLRSSHVDVYRTLDGSEKTYKKEEVKRRQELPISLMPGALLDSLTDEELADLVAFLTNERL